MEGNIDSARSIIKQLVPNIKSEPELSPSYFIKKYWKLYKDNFPSNQNTNGKFLEELIAICLIRENVLPFYMQAKVAFIEYVNYDFILYSLENGPISISAKTSLRERWKQADLEAVVLKHIHRKSESYVVTLDIEAVRRRRVDKSQILGIDEFVLADSEEFDELVLKIKKHTLNLSPTVEIVNSNTIITQDNFLERYI